MFSQKSRLQQLQEEYQRQLKQHDGRPDRLISADEVWRLFVEGKAQRGSKQIAAYFKQGAPDCSLREFAEQESEGGEWQQAPFIKFLASKYWYPSDTQYDMRISDFLVLDQAWLQYENEAGYLAKLYRLYPALFDFSVKLDADLILSFHQQAVSGVKETAYEQEPEEKPGTFRESFNCGMILFAENFSEKGIREWLTRTEQQLKKRSDYQLAYTISVYTPDNEFMGVINLDYWLMPRLREYIKHKLPRPESASTALQQQRQAVQGAWKAFVRECCFPADECDKQFLQFLKSDASVNTILEKIGSTQTNVELAHCLCELTREMNQTRQLIRESRAQQVTYDAMLNSQQYVDPQAVSAWLYTEVNQMFDRFKQKMEKIQHNPAVVLAEIIALVQDLHQLHPFLDGNGRTLCILLFNHLLLRHGFPPCMQENTAIFSLCSREEIMQSVLAGMEQTLRINNKACYPGPSTKAVLSNLAAHPALHAYLEEFNTLVQNEECRRQAKQQPSPTSL